MGKVIQFRLKSTEFAAIQGKIFFEKGIAAEGKGNVRDAKNFYLRAISIDPAASGALVNLSAIECEGRKFNLAEEYCRRALEIDPNYPLAHFNLANIFHTLGRLDKAVTHYQQGIKIDPWYADSFFNLAIIYEGAGEFLKALWHWKRYIILNPDSNRTRNARKQLKGLESRLVIPGGRHQPLEPHASHQNASKFELI